MNDVEAKNNVKTNEWDKRVLLKQINKTNK